MLVDCSICFLKVVDEDATAEYGHITDQLPDL